jgi:hypothetical protein
MVFERAAEEILAAWRAASLVSSIRHEADMKF